MVVDQQEGGRGRSGNKWLSPPGCAMFSLQLEFEVGRLRSLPLVQHLVGLAAVHAVNSNRPEAKLRLKWPNDIYTRFVFLTTIAPIAFSHSKHLLQF